MDGPGEIEAVSFTAGLQKTDGITSLFFIALQAHLGVKMVAIAASNVGALDDPGMLERALRAFKRGTRVKDRPVRSLGLSSAPRSADRRSARGARRRVSGGRGPAADTPNQSLPPSEVLAIHGVSGASQTSEPFEHTGRNTVIEVQHMNVSAPPQAPWGKQQTVSAVPPLHAY